MSILGLLCLLLGLVATLVLVLYGLQRRELKGVEELSQQLRRIAIGGRLGGRIELTTEHHEPPATGTTINHRLARASGPAERQPNIAATPKLFSELGDRIHEA